MTTRASRDGDDWILNGTKMWITNAPVADVAVIWARTDEGRHHGGSASPISGFVVPMDTPGVTASEVHHKLSLRASSTGEIVLDEVRLPAAAQLPEATGLKAPLSCLTEARYGIVWGALGAARDCLETAIAYATNREQFGRPIAGFQLTQAKLADMAVELQKGFLLALHLGRLADAGTAAPGAGQRGQAQQRPGGAGDRPQLPHDPGRERHQPGVPGAAARQQPGERAHLRGHLGDPPAGGRAAADRDRRIHLGR